MSPLLVKVKNIVLLRMRGNLTYCSFDFKAIINYAKENSERERAGEPKSSIGIGLAMAIGLFFLTVMASICQHQVCGVL